MPTIFVLAGLIAFFVWSERDLRRRKRKALEALRADCDAKQVLTNWRLANQGVPISGSTEARWLVMKCIRTYEAFLKTHPNFEDNGLLDSLNAFLDGGDSPPGEKRQLPPIPFRPRP